jgi:hypothetical protein
MKFTKIFDVTDDESPPTQSHAETEATHTAHVDDSEKLVHSDEDQQPIQHDLEVILPESKEIMAEWTCAEIKVDEISSGELKNDLARQDLSPTDSSSSIESMDSFYKPEADQKEREQLLSEYVATDLRWDVKDYATVTRDIDE